MTDFLKNSTQQAEFTEDMKQNLLNTINEYCNVDGKIDPEKTKTIINIIREASSKNEERWKQLEYYYQNVAFIEIQSRSNRNARIAKVAYWDGELLEDMVKDMWYEIVVKSEKNDSWFDGVFLRHPENNEEVFVFRGTELLKFDGDVSASLSVWLWYIPWAQIQDMIKFYKENPISLEESSIIWHSLWGYLAQVLKIHLKMSEEKNTTRVNTYNSPWIWADNITELEWVFRGGDLSIIEKRAEEQKKLFTKESMNAQIDKFLDEQIQLASIQIGKVEWSAVSAVERDHSLEVNIETMKNYLEEKHPDIDLDKESWDKYWMRFNDLPDIRMQASLIIVVLQVLWWLWLGTYVAWCLIKEKQENYKLELYDDVWNFVGEECPHLITNTVFMGERIWFQAYIKGSVSHSIKEVVEDLGKMSIEDFRESVKTHPDLINEKTSK